MKRAPLTFLIMLLLSLSGYPVPRTIQQADYQAPSVPITQLGPKRSGPRASFMYYTHVLEPLRIVIRENDTWRGTWKRIHLDYSEVPPLPEIDFSREMIIFVALGERPTGGYGIIIDSVYERNDRLEVVVRSVLPGKTCGLTQAVTAPIDIVRLPNKIGHSVSFRETEVVHECE
jgi:hypothetical protein